MKKLICLGFGLAALACAQEPQRLTLPFRDPSMPKKLNVELMLGSITVKGYDGNDAIIEYTGRSIRPSGRGGDAPPGMHRIGGSGGLEVTEEANTIRIRNGSFISRGDLVIQVPVQTSVTVKTMSGQNLTVDNIAGEIEANNFNGQVTVTNASGSVVAHSMNGKVTVSLNKVAPDKNMSFSTMNGDVDVTLPADTKANLRMRADDGDIFTDFDVNMGPPAAPQVQEEKDKSGRPRTRARISGAEQGTINGGGPEMQFTTFNGRILIHKK